MVSSQSISDDLTVESFLTYFKGSRLLKVGLAFNLIYYFAVVVGFLILLWTGELSNTVYTVDFQVFYEAGGVVMISPSDLYNTSPNGLPYRYLPVFSLLFSILHSLPLEVLYLTNISLMMLTNFAILWMVYRVCIAYGVFSQTKNFEKTLSIIFIAPQHIVNLILGQVTQVGILLILATLLVLQKAESLSLKQYLLVGLLIGAASTLKPFFLLLCVFAIPVTRSARLSFTIPVKSIIGVLGGFSLAMLPNALFFWIYPESLNGFIRVNFSEYLDYHHSTSITRLLIDAIPFLQSELLQHIIIAFLSFIIFSISYIRFINTPNSSKKYIIHFSEVIFLVLLVYPDSWFLFIAVWYSIFGPSILVLYKSMSNQLSQEKKLDLLWSGSNNLVAFFWIGVLFYYLILGFDPLVPIWLLILYLLFLHLLKLNRLADKNNNSILAPNELV